MCIENVITLYNRFHRAYSSADYLWGLWMAEKDPLKKQRAIEKFLRQKERVATLLECLHVVTKGVGGDYRMNAYQRDDS